MNYFYQSYTLLESIFEELESMDLSDQERNHLSALIDSMLHHAILDEILSNLSNEDKKLFLKKLNDNPEDIKLMEFLKERVGDIEERIQRVSEELVKELHKDVEKTKLAPEK